jgi:hypothetical protein
MPAHDFYEAMLYESMEPFGGRRDDIQTAILAATIVNAMRAPKTKPARPEDFLMKWDEMHQPKRAKTPMEMLATMQRLQKQQETILKAHGQID